jgi:O-antigen/teichoic acid export membrane protein
MRTYAIFKGLRYVLIPASILVIVGLGLPYDCLALSLSVSELVLFFGLMVYIHTRLFRFRWPLATRFWLSEHAWFGIRGVLSGVLTELDTRIDVLMLGYFSNDTTVGLYSFAAILAEGIGQIPLVLRQNIDPIIGRHFATGDKEKIEDLARRVRKVFYPLMGWVALMAVLSYPVLFKLSSSENGLKQSWAVFVIIMIGIVINAGYRPFLGMMLQGGRPDVNTLFVGILVVSNVILNALFISMLGLYGAAVVNVLLYSLEAVLLAVFSRKLFRVCL